MQTLTDDQFYKLLDKEGIPGCSTIGNIIKGTLIHEHEYCIKGSHDVFFYIFKDPKHRITNGQLCTIFDDGNHCISYGSIVYEQDYAYIIWSNLGHI